MVDKYTIDLDELADKPITVIFGGVEHEIEAPDFDDFIAIAQTASAFNNVEGGIDDEFASNLKKIKEELGKLCPPVAGKKLNLPQIMRLLFGLQQACIPEDIQALDELGISPAKDGNNSKKD